MSSHERLQRIRGAAIAGALSTLLGACPSLAENGPRERRTVLAQADSEGRDPVEATQDRVTLRDALARALEHSPDLASYAWEIRAREARTLQAGLLPNPTLSAEVENIGGSGPKDGIESAETTLTLSQLVELGGKRGKRRSVAASEAEVAKWEYEGARLAVVAETTAAFVDALAQQDALLLAGEQIALAEEVLRAIQAQVRAGAVSSAEIPRAEVEVTHQRIESRVRKRALRAAYVRLATTWGESEPGFSSLAGDLSSVSPIPSEAALVERMRSAPEIARWEAEVTRRRDVTRLEDARRIPDVTLGLGPRHFEDSNDWALVVGVQMPIPVFDRNQGARQESLHQLARSREQRRSAALRLRRELASSYQGLAAAYEEVVGLRDEAIPTAERAYTETKRAQRQGALRFTDVLDAQRSLFAIRTRLVRARASYHVARAQTEALIGGPLATNGDARK
jgi:cobalt-zinc-cadmium efflux system outer membrane protein